MKMRRPKLSWSDRAARLLYERVVRGNPRLCPDTVRRNITLLSEGGTPRAEVERYYIRKLSQTLLTLAAGLVIAVLLALMPAAGLMTEEGRISRDAAGGATRRTVLTAQDADGSTLGAFPLTVEAQRYTRAEEEALFLELSERLPEAILGDNVSLLHVRDNLNLVNRLPGLPFTIRWESDNYALLYTDGTVMTRDLPPEGARVTLTAVCSYAGSALELTIPVTLLPPEQSAEEALSLAIVQALSDAQEKTLYQPEMELPPEVDGREIRWREETENRVPLVLLFFGIAAAGVYLVQDSRLSERIRDREDALMRAYPQFVSRLSLYLSTGMSMRTALSRLSLAGGERDAVLCSELKRLLRAMQNGVSEADALEAFAGRCRLQPYTRLVSLLVQHGKRGNATLLQALHAEAQSATALRLDRAKIRGEQAGTKLVFPMTLMLGIVMILVMVPAWLSF